MNTFENCGSSTQNLDHNGLELLCEKYGESPTIISSYDRYNRATRMLSEDVNTFTGTCEHSFALLLVPFFFWC